MGDMEIVRQFNSELSTIYETKPPISKAKVSSVTRLAVKAIKYYKHVVQSIEKFAQKCRQEYKIPALYVMDSVIRQSRHQFGAEKDVYGPRFAKNITVTFQHIFRCSPEEQGKVIKVLNLWQKSGIYSPDVIQPLLNLPSTLSQGEIPSAMDQLQEPTEEIPVDQDAPNVNNQLATALEEQRQEHMQQIQLLQQQLQEQQRINAQQQQQLQQQHLIPGMPVMPGMQPEPQELQPAFEAAQQSQVPVDDAVVAAGEAQASSVPQPKFQLQPEVFAQIQALTGMNIRMPQANQAAAPDSSTGPPQTNIAEGINSDAMQPDKGPGPVNEIPGYPDGANFGAPPGMPVWGPHGMAPGASHPGPLQDEGRSSVIDDFDYGDDDDDASRIAEQRRHLMEEERRLSQEAHPRMGELQRDFQNTFRQVGETPDRHPDPAGPFGRRSPDLHHRERSPGSHYHKPRSPRRRSRSPRWRDRSPRRRSRSPFGRERERDRDRDRDRDRGRNRDRERDWHKDRDSDRERGRGSDRESEKRNDGIPLPKKETLSVCSTTIWVGHLAKTVMKENLMEVFEANQLTVSSIDMVPPRGCAYVVMVNRHDASRVLVTLKNTRIHGNSLKLAWAAGKGVKGKEYKEYFDAEQGVAFIPWSKLGSGVDLQALGEGSWIDPETLPPGLQNSVVKEGSEAGSTDTSNTKDEKDLGTMSQEELMKLAAAQAGTEAKGPEQGTPSGLPLNPLGQPPQQIPPPGPHMFPGHHPMIPPPMMIQPPFPAAPLPPNMIPPGAPPPNMAGVPPPNVGGPPVHQFNPSAAPAVTAPSGPPGPPPNLGRPQERGQFPPDHTRFPSGMPQDTGQFPPQFPGRPQENAQFPPQDGNFPPGRTDEGGPFPPRRPSDEGQLPPQHPGDQFPPHHPVRPQGSGHFTPHHPGRPHDSGQFPPRHPGRFPDGPFPSMHHRPPTFHQRPPHHMRMPHFHPGGPRFPHDIPPLMPSGGPPRVPEFGPHPWGQGPGLMRGPPPHGGPPHGGPLHGRPDNKLPEEGAHHEAAEDWNEERTKDSKEGQQDEMNTGNKDNSVERPDGEREFPRGPRREFGDRERDRSRERSWERGRDREDRGRDRDDRSRNREREDRFRGRDRGRDRERDRDRDRGRDRDWDRDDRRRDRDLNGDRDVPRDGPKRRSRFEPREENRVTESEVKENAVIETRRASCEVTSTIAQNSTNELASREEGEIVDGNENESGNIAMESETINISRDHEAKNIPIGNQAANFPQENETTNIPRNNEIMDTPAGDNLDITKDSEAVSFHQESNDLSSSRNFAEDTFKLPKQEIHEIEQASS